MNRTWIATAVVALAAAGISFWLGRTTAPVEEQNVSSMSAEEIQALEEAEAARAAEVAEKGVALSSPQAREAHLLGELEQERGRIEKLEQELASLKEQQGSTPDAVDDATAAKERARYVYEGTEKALKVLDLDKAGEALSTMTPLIDELLASIKAGTPKMELQSDISRWNATLLSQALQMQGSGLPGNGVNGVFTHPAIQVNYIYATLRAAEKPLTEKQEGVLKEIGDRFVKEEQRRVAGYDETTFALQKLADEADVKTRFYADVDALLTHEQREALHPERMRGRIRADLFSSGLLWAAVAGPLKFKDRNDLAKSIAGNALRHLQLGSEHESLVGELAVDYAAGFPDAYLGHTPDGLDDLGLMHEARVLVAARHMESFLKSLADRLPVDDVVRTRIRNTTFVLVPMRSSSS